MTTNVQYHECTVDQRTSGGSISARDQFHHNTERIRRPDEADDRIITAMRLSLHVLLSSVKHSTASEALPVCVRTACMLALARRSTPCARNSRGRQIRVSAVAEPRRDGSGIFNCTLSRGWMPAGIQQTHQTEAKTGPARRACQY
jgi:hypothetical protein